jgi:NTE family protein
VGKAYQHRIEEHKAPNILQVMMQSFYITAYSLAQHTLEHADSVIEPDVSHFSVTDFNKAKELIAHGRVAAQKAIPEIKRKLGQL